MARSAEAKHALESVAIHGADIHAGALGLAEQAAQAAGVRRHVKLKRSDVRELSLEGLPPVTHVVTNPPWGLRLQVPALFGRVVPLTSLIFGRLRAVWACCPCGAVSPISRR